jgi:hypothetical protein
MKKLLLAACVCTLTATITQAAETTMRYDTDRTRVAHEDNDRYWRDYGANEVNFSFFGSGTVGDDTLSNVSADRIERDGKLGMGLGLSYFFHRNIGIEGWAYSESTGGRHFVDNVGGDLIGRFPIGHSGFAPYVLGGGGRQLDPVIQWTWDAGGGLEWRFTEHVGIFVDARFVWADDTKDYGLGRLGMKFGF